MAGMLNSDPSLTQRVEIDFNRLLRDLLFLGND